VLEFSRQADYAVRAVLELSHFPQGTLMHSIEIAERQDVPAKYFPTVIRNLVRAGIINTYRGSRGGVSLAEAPHEITLRDVIEAVDGPINLNRCGLQSDGCRDGVDEHCTMHDFWERMALNILEVLENTSFADLANNELDMGI
jgi:Rrf2 family protein